jgi:hypothetical protein
LGVVVEVWTGCLELVEVGAGFGHGGIVAERSTGWEEEGCRVTVTRDVHVPGISCSCSSLPRC